MKEYLMIRSTSLRCLILMALLFPVTMPVSAEEEKTSESEQPKVIQVPAVSSSWQETGRKYLQLNEQVDQKLEMNFKFEFYETPLSEVAGLISDVLEIPVLFDEQVREVAEEIPITYIGPELSVYVGLCHLLPQELDFYIDKGAIVITVKQLAEQKMLPKVYQIDQPEAELDQLHGTMLRFVDPQSWYQQQTRSRTDGIPMTLSSPFITRIGQKLVIYQTLHNHRKIAELLVLLTGE